MTDKQEKAIQVLLRLTQSKSITDEEYILLLDFIVANKEQTTTIPFVQRQPCTNPDGTCTNPFHDCINCPKTFDSGKGTWTSTDTNKVAQQ